MTENNTTWRVSTTREIHDYYQNAFPGKTSRIPRFIRESKPKQIGLAFEEAHPVRGENIPDRDFIRRNTFTKSGSGQLQGRFTGWSGSNSLVSFIQSPAVEDPLEGDKQLVEPELAGKAAVPEAVYYSVDFHDRNWALAIDIDAKDTALSSAEGHIDSTGLTDQGIREKAGIIQAPPTGRKYRFEDIEQTLEYGFRVEEFLRDTLGSEETTVVYSGQGCHIYLHEDAPEYRYDTRNRRFLADHLENKLNIPIDRQVTTDSERVMRLPYSLHAGVSRIVTPIESPDFDFKTEPVPDCIETVNNRTETGQESVDAADVIGGEGQ